MWFRSLCDHLRRTSSRAGRRGRPTSPRRPAPHKPLLELLEDRYLLSLAPAAGSPFAAGTGPQAIVTADFNGDGKLDLATANSQDSTVSVLLGNGDGTFQAALKSSTGSAPVSLAVGDFNGDGKPDLVTANSGGDLSVLLGKGDDTFGSATSVSLSLAAGLQQTPRSVAVGDFNKDGKLDLAVTGQTSFTQVYFGYYYTSYSTIYQGYANVLLGDGSGGFTAGSPQALNSTSPDSVQVGDLNGDGKLDVVTANPDLSSVGVLLGNGDGTLRTETDYATGSSPLSVAVGDLNGDGKLDLVSANVYGNSVSALVNNGDGTFQAAKTSASSALPESIALADLNGDGKLDVVTANYASSGSANASALLGKGDGTFAPPLTTAVGTGPSGVVAGDFNGDGKSDVAVANFGPGNVSVLLNDGSWPAADAPTVSIGNTSVTEGNTGTTNANFTVSLSAASTQTITVAYATADGTATAGSDYTATSGTVTFAPGQTTATIAVAVVGDRIAEPNETFTVTLSQPTNAFLNASTSTGVGTIVDDEPRISITNVTQNEGNKGNTAFVFTVSLSVAYDTVVTVNYSTSDGTATVANNDYIPTSGTLTFLPGQTTATITVYVVGDRKVEPNEYFYVNLSNPSSDAMLADQYAIGTILNNDHSGGKKRKHVASGGVRPGCSRGTQGTRPARPSQQP